MKQCPLALAALFAASSLFAAGPTAAGAAAEVFDIGAAADDAAFWSSDPVIFVKKHEKQRFAFTSDAREGADTRIYGKVTWRGLPAYETKVYFADGGISHFDVVLFTSGGTEMLKQLDARHWRVEHEDKPMSRDEYLELLDKVRAALTPAGTRAPTTKSENLKDGKGTMTTQVWPKTDKSTQTTLVWSYKESGRRVETFSPGFVRVTVDGPKHLAAASSQRGTKVSKSAKKIAQNVVKDPEGDVYIGGVPMVDQGQKGYCAAAAAERVLKYYGVEVDEHVIAQAAGTTAGGGTRIDNMRDAIAAIGKKSRLSTKVFYGDLDKDVGRRIENIEDEVKAYNKTAKQMNKPQIKEGVYKIHNGNTVTYNWHAARMVMDPEVSKEMIVRGRQRGQYQRFMNNVKDNVKKGIPLLWGVELGIYPEPQIPQAMGGHMRLIIGFNEKKNEVIYSDSWGAGHEKKRMPADWAFMISRCLVALMPAAR